MTVCTDEALNLIPKRAESPVDFQSVDISGTEEQETTRVSPFLLRERNGNQDSGAACQLLVDADDSILLSDRHTILAVMRATQAISDWSILALLLELSQADLNNIESAQDKQKQRKSIIIKWLDSGTASWAVLVKALNDELVKQGAIAKEIAKKYPKSKKEKASTKGKHHKSEKYRGMPGMVAKKTEITTDDKLDFDSDDQSDMTYGSASSIRQTGHLSPVNCNVWTASSIIIVLLSLFFLFYFTPSNHSCATDVEKSHNYFSGYATPEFPSWYSLLTICALQYMPPCVRTITNVTKYKLNGDSWYSLPFYTGPGGYKLQLRVDADSSSTSLSTNISLSMYLMRGENDDCLKWPFMGFVSFKLLNWIEDENHLEYSFSTSLAANPQSFGRVTDGVRGTEEMYQKIVITHEQLEFDSERNTQYKMDDVLCFVISSVEVWSRYESSLVPQWTHPELSKLSYGVLPVYRTVKQLNELKENNLESYTEPFYTSQGGYKLRLGVYPNGFGQLEGKCLSVFMYLMKGEDDHALSFPINGTFKLILLNWRENSGHIEKIIKFDESNPEKSRVLSYNDLESAGCKYIHNNTLCFKVEFEGCISYFRLSAKTGYQYDAAQHPLYGENPRFAFKMNGKIYYVPIDGDKNEGSTVTKDLYIRQFSPTPPQCVSLSTISAAYLNAPPGATDGWYVASINVDAVTLNSVQAPLSSDPNFNKYIDYDEEDLYTYNTKMQPLSLLKNAKDNCITQLKIDCMTGNSYGAAFDPYYQYGHPHYIELTLKGSEHANHVRAAIKGPTTIDKPYTVQLSLQRDFLPNDKCVTRADIQKVALVAGGRDGWHIASINTYFKVGGESYRLLTSDPNLNKTLDDDEPELYKYNAKKLVLTIIAEETEDRPMCGYGTQVCECKSNVATCIFSLEIDEIRTFTSYHKFPVADGNEMFVQGTQGVIYHISESSGLAQPHPFFKNETCSKLNYTKCSDPQFVDGKTYRMAIGVNGQIPGPTLIVHDGQLVMIHVHNNLSTEGISIHWHGMHQIGTPWMDGVGQVTQCQIEPSSTFIYKYTASPSGTFWYHSHSGGQRTDGFFGTLIVREKPDRLLKIKKELARYGVDDFEDHPSKHTLTLLDWQQEASLDSFSQVNAKLGFFEEAGVSEAPDPKHKRYESTHSVEQAEVGPVPYFSGLINGKGRHNDVPYAKTRLSVFDVEQNKRYRFRLIGAQGLYAYKFSIDGHKLTVVNTDGYWIIPQKEVDFIIIHAGERYDFILEANNNVQNYWMQAETLEINQTEPGPPYRSLGHVAEGILQYTNKGQAAPVIPSTDYAMIKGFSPKISCNDGSHCRAINCPFKDFHKKYHTSCINVNELKLLQETESNRLPLATPSLNCDDCKYFINFNPEGQSETSSVNGRNFVFPPVPPQTQNKEFHEQAIECDLDADCNPSTLGCLCTHIIDIPYQKTIQFVLTAMGAYDTAYPIHLHGHAFHVVHVGYPEYDPSNGFIKEDEQGRSLHNKDIKCADVCDDYNDPTCRRCTKPGWNGAPPDFTICTRTIRKDTVIVPAGGYVVINFISDNPGHWFLHSHIAVHQLEGMALIVNEAPEEQKKLQPPETMNRCGAVVSSVEQFEKCKKMSTSIKSYTNLQSASHADQVDFPGQPKRNP